MIIIFLSVGNTLAGGKIIKFRDDHKIYYGTEIAVLKRL